MCEIIKNIEGNLNDIHFGTLSVCTNNGDYDKEAMNTLKDFELSTIREKYKDYNRKEFIKTEPICHYVKHYKKFKKTYPVLLQLESIILKNRDIAVRSIFLDTMFLAEIKDLLLTGIHDLDCIEGKLSINVAKGNEVYEGITQKEVHLKEHDIYLSDEKGIISSLVGGPDYRTRVTPESKNVLYFIYGTEGVNNQNILQHLNTIKHYFKKVNFDCKLKESFI